MKTKLFFLSTLFVSVNIMGNAQTWTQKTSLPAPGRAYAFSFSIGTKGYMGTGSDNFMDDFWEWDQPTDTWTQKANYGGGGRLGVVGFSIGNKGYGTTGNDKTAAPYYFRNDLWEYDPSLNKWTKKANMGGPARTFATGFSIGAKGYLGTGYTRPDDLGSKDFWEWNQASNAWTQKADVGGPARTAAVGFSIGNQGYIGTGTADYMAPTASLPYNDFWAWDQATNTWTKKADLPGAARCMAVGFSLNNNKGYIGTGIDKAGSTLSDFWEYDPATDTWTRRPDHNGGGVRAGVGFSIGNKGYIAIGTNAGKTNPFNQLWEYADTATAIQCTISITAFADPASICTGNTIAIYASGGTSYLWNTGAAGSHITETPTVTTTYNVTGSNAVGCTGTANITITVQDCTTGIDEINSSASVLVSPNPFSESATVIITGVEGSQLHEMKIYDMLGNEVRSINFNGAQTTIERKNLSDGVYFYRIQTPLSLLSPFGGVGGGRAGGEVVTGKFIIGKE